METKEGRYQSLMRTIALHAPTTDISLVNRAFEFADNKHKSQLRKSGEPYIIHPLAVAEIVVESGLDTDAILAALLHDCLEDTDASYEEIVRLFGNTVAELVEGVTKLTRVNFSTTEEKQMENLRKMFMAMSKDIRVILIKIADRLHNMRTLEYQTAPKQILKSTETMEIYAPLAHRLGMQKLKWELEDLALRYLDPAGYQEILDFLAAHKDQDEQFMNTVQSTITDRLEGVGIHGTIYGRIKHVYSIYRKLKDQNKTIDELYDIYAFRVIVDSIADCYNVLGHIHDLFNLVPGRFKDYISTPKPNRYQSLHTTVIGDQGVPFEVQIRTWEMHETAEYGVAAHWKYKQGTGEGQEKEFEWVRRLLESQQDTEAEDYIHSLRVDMFDDEVFVFTPKGRCISLPAKSTPIDFAYAIHSGVGNTMIGAKVNNRIAGFDMQLSNGDIVEVLTSKSAKGPSRDWLKLCQSNQARVKIKQWFKKEKREENILHGKASFEGELRRLNVDPAVLQSEDVLAMVLRKVSFDTLDDMYAAIGYGGMTAVKCVNKIRDDLLKAVKAAAPKDNLTPKPLQSLNKKSAASGSSGVIVDGLGSCMVKFARCCTPVPGDDIIGFVTRGYGVSIHRTDCINATQEQIGRQPERWVPASWAATSEQYETSLEIDCRDRDGLLLDLATVMTTQRVKVREMGCRTVGDGDAVASLTFSIHDVEELNTICAKLRAVSGVVQVRRGKT